MIEPAHGRQTGNQNRPEKQSPSQHEFFSGGDCNGFAGGRKPTGKMGGIFGPKTPRLELYAEPIYTVNGLN